MHALKVLAAFILFVSGTAFPLQGNTSSEIHDEILKVYSFQPHLLTTAQIDERSSELDKFWTEAQTYPDRYVPGLRQELDDAKNPPFFFYDGSMLLLKLSDTPPDRKIALKAIARCDLHDVQSKDYFYQVHRLAALGEDTTVAAFHILEDPKFKVFIPQHVLTLGQDYALIYMLLPTEPKFWEAPAIQRLNQESDTTAQKSLVLLLWYAQDNAADQALHAISQDQNRSADLRKLVQDLENRERQIRANGKKGGSHSSESDLRRRRSEIMSAVSDEALDELDAITAQLIAERGH